MENEYIRPEDVITPISETPGKIKKKKKKKKQVESGLSFIQFLNGEFLVKDFVIKNLAYVFFIFFMFIFLIAKGYYAKDLIKKTEKAQEKLNARSADYVESKARLEMRTRRNELVNRLKKVELYETTKPAKVIRINRLKTD